MRAIVAFLVVCLLAMVACRGTKQKDGDTIDLTQNVTSDRKPQDKIFVDFEKNWRQFVSASPDLALAVVRGERKRPEQAWEPTVVGECVFSADAGGMVPQVTLTWNEPGSGSPGIAAAQQRQPEVPRLRFDLSLHHNGFGRNYFSTVLATDKNHRFELPSNSALVNDQAAVLLSGPGLFPKLIDFNVQSIQERGTGRQIERQTLVLRDLNPGLSYTVRRDRPAANGWRDDGQIVFLTPVCPQGI